MTGIRVLRVIEYIYSHAAKAEEDMARWTHQHSSSDMIMRSATLPFEAIPFPKEERPVPVVMMFHHEPVDAEAMTDEQLASYDAPATSMDMPDMSAYTPEAWQRMSHKERMWAIQMARSEQAERRMT